MKKIANNQTRKPAGPDVVWYLLHLPEFTEKFGELKFIADLVERALNNEDDIRNLRKYAIDRKLNPDRVYHWKQLYGDLGWLLEVRVGGLLAGVTLDEKKLQITKHYFDLDGEGSE